MMPVETAAPEPRNVLSPSTLNRLVRELLEDALPMVWIEGEISNFMRAASGHWYFSLKDAGAEVRCAMFARSNARLGLQPGNGSKVLARARVSLYEARGSFQLLVEAMQDAGEGALRRAFELLKARLQAEGLFDPTRKRALPACPRRIGIITSAHGAAIRDVLAVAARRFALTELEVLPVLVQGAEAPAQLAAMLRKASEARRYDVLLLTRGGGSLEDLQAFNDEAVARAIVASAVPVVSAVGHESDWSISDWVADLRAPTPSAAAELLLPDGEALARHAQHLAARIETAGGRLLQSAMQQLDQLATRLHTQRPQQRLANGRERMLALHGRLLRSQSRLRERAAGRLTSAHVRLSARQPGVRVQRAVQAMAELRRRVMSAWSQRLTLDQQQLAERARALQAVSPLGVMQRGYAILFDESGQLLRSAQAAHAGERVRARLADGEISLRVETPK